MIDETKDHGRSIYYIYIFICVRSLQLHWLEDVAPVWGFASWQLMKQINLNNNQAPNSLSIAMQICMDLLAAMVLRLLRLLLPRC